MIRFKYTAYHSLLSASIRLFGKILFDLEWLMILQKVISLLEGIAGQTVF